MFEGIRICRRNHLAIAPTMSVWTRLDLKGSSLCTLHFTARLAHHLNENHEPTELDQTEVSIL